MSRWQMVTAVTHAQQLADAARTLWHSGAWHSPTSLPCVISFLYTSALFFSVSLDILSFKILFPLIFLSYLFHYFLVFYLSFSLILFFVSCSYLLFLFPLCLFPEVTKCALNLGKKILIKMWRELFPLSPTKNILNNLSIADIWFSFFFYKNKAIIKKSNGMLDQLQQKYR